MNFVSLKYALLALLTGTPMTGYEIGKQFGTSVGFVWHAPTSQIYPELRRLAQAGLLDVEEVSEGRRKKRYSITEAGIHDLADWMNQPVVPEPSRDATILRVAYLEWADPEAARAQLELMAATFEERRAILESVLTTLRSRTHPRLAERLQALPPGKGERAVAFKVYAFEGMVEAARQQAQWARRGLGLLDQLDAGATSRGSNP